MRASTCAARGGATRRFLAAALASRALHGRWVQPPATPRVSRAYVARFGAPPRGRRAPTARRRSSSFRNDDDALVGVFNFGDIVRGAFRSAYLGYYAFAPHAGPGYMTEALALALDLAFGDLGLHRVEANVQPANLRSLALAERAGFVARGLFAPLREDRAAAGATTCASRCSPRTGARAARRRARRRRR